MEGTLAEIRGFASNFAPKNWIYCYGQLVKISDNQALFSLLGDRFGGDGRITFGIPDLRGRVPIGAGQGPGLDPYYLAEMGGLPQIALSNQQLPKHTHETSVSGSGSLNGSVTAKMNVNSADGEERNPDGLYLGVSSVNDLYQDSPTAGKTLNTGAITVDTSGLSVSISDVDVTVAQTGSGDPFPVIQPYLAISWIICVDGTYPTRNNG